MKSTNGGTTWTIKTHWSGATGVQTVHADKHVLEWQGTNGPLGRASGGSAGHLMGHRNIRQNGMMISMIYRIGVSQTSSKGYVIASGHCTRCEIQMVTGRRIAGWKMDYGAIKNIDANTIRASIIPRTT